MHRIIFALFFILHSLQNITCSASENDTTVIWQSVPEYRETNTNSLFRIPESIRSDNQKNIINTLEARYNGGGLSTSLEANQILLENEDNQYENTVNELYYDFTLLGQDFTIGKKTTSWGVGYGFRPLDVIQQEDRRLLYNETLEGMPLVSWSHFSENWSVKFLYTSSSRNDFGNDLAEESLVSNFQTYWKETDIHSLLRISEKNRYELGMGFSNVVNDQLEFHGSFLYQKRYTKLINSLSQDSSSQLAAQNPMEIQQFENGLKALLGFTWSTIGGLSIIGEVWYDENAYSKEEWGDLFDLTTNQRQLLGASSDLDLSVYSNILASSLSFRQTSVQQKNVFLRINYVKSEWSSGVEGLLTPQDHGWILTTFIEWEGNQHRLQSGIRIFDGSTDSVYNHIPEDKIGYVLWRWTYPLT